ncbi:MAG: hypothetical protein OEW18_10325, partial [Candidatus Aminicenantes bacterium]|nr:hypothetical protein [Candidatus Aminicenantes bacterium]
MKKLPVKAVLYVSLGFIVLTWVDKVIRNVFHMENILRTFESLPRVFLQALLTGLWTVFSVTVLLL